MNGATLLITLRRIGEIADEDARSFQITPSFLSSVRLIQRDADVVQPTRQQRLTVRRQPLTPLVQLIRRCQQLFVVVPGIRLIPRRDHINVVGEQVEFLGAVEVVLQVLIAAHDHVFVSMLRIFAQGFRGAGIVQRFDDIRRQIDIPHCASFPPSPASIATLHGFESLQTGCDHAAERLAVEDRRAAPAVITCCQAARQFFRIQHTGRAFRVGVAAVCIDLLRGYILTLLFESGGAFADRFEVDARVAQRLRNQHRRHEARCRLLHTAVRIVFQIGQRVEQYRGERWR